MSNHSDTGLDFDPTAAEQAMFAEKELSKNESKVDSRRRLEDKLADLALAKDIREFDFDI